MEERKKTDVLNSYLLQHKSLNIPGVGTIYIQNKAAITDFVNKQLFPASFSYRFEKVLDPPESAFYHYLSARTGMGEYEVIQWYNDYAAEVRSKIKNDGYFDWKGVGRFRRDELSGDVLLEQQQKLLPLLAPVPARRVIRKDARHAILVGDQQKTNVQMSELLNEEEMPKPAVRRARWWIYALVLFVVACALIFWHFYRLGFNWSATGNQQQIRMEQR